MLGCPVNEVPQLPPDILRTVRPSTSLPVLMVTAVLAALVVFGVAAVAQPASALGASIQKVTACGANLRTRESTSATLKVALKANTRVTVATSVTGGSWKISCAGKIVSGKFWYRISAIAGKSVKSVYGVTYLYAASGLFKPFVVTPLTRYAACNAYLRTSPSTSAPSKVLIKTNWKVIVATTVSGAAWKATCNGTTSGSSVWYRISAVNGSSVKALYGVTYLYAAPGLFKASLTTPTATPPPSAPAPTPNPKIAEGIDVSHWQGPIDWTAVAKAGKKFAYLKASQDIDFVDDTYATNRAGAQAQGLHIGAYHFAQPSVEVGDATAEADHFIDTAMPVGGDLLPVLDLEKNGGLTQDALIAWVKEYLGRINERLGVHAVIYCSPNFWKNSMADTTWFADNGYEVLWVAHWTTASTPTVPGGAWSSNAWTFWQYTSDGSVPGITGRVDLDRYNGTDFSAVLIP